MSQRLKDIDYIGVILWVFRAAIILLVVVGIFNKVVRGYGTQYTASDWVDFVGSGLSQGSLYALIALGYTMVYGILFMINFAHGEFFMAGRHDFHGVGSHCPGFRRIYERPANPLYDHCHGRFNGHGNGHFSANRTHRLSSAAQGTAACAAYHGHWRLLLLAVLLSWLVRFCHHPFSRPRNI